MEAKQWQYDKSCRGPESQLSKTLFCRYSGVQLLCSVLCMMSVIQAILALLAIGHYVVAHSDSCMYPCTPFLGQTRW